MPVLHVARRILSDSKQRKRNEMATLFDVKADAGPKVRGITIIVPGKPIPWKRPHLFAQLAAGQELWLAARESKTPSELRDKLKRLVSVRALPHAKGDSDEQVLHQYRMRIRNTAREIFLGEPWEGAVYMEILFLMPRPKYKHWKTKPMPRYPHISVPDKDNLEKGVKDSLKGVAYRDDSQVADSRVSKWVCAGGESPKTIIKLAKIEG